MTIEEAVLQIRTQTVPTADTEMVEWKVSKVNYDALETITKALSDGYVLKKVNMTDMSSVNMYARIKYLLKQRNLKISDLEKVIGVSSGYFSRLEDNFESLSFRYVIKIAEFFKISIDDLLHGNVEEENVSVS